MNLLNMFCFPNLNVKDSKRIVKYSDDWIGTNEVRGKKQNVIERHFSILGSLFFVLAH
jgi:hypothetical protein